ncbi:hypothetical protein INT45_001880 [Circinella minor]|uniref:Association with the SNF1 complex (ASC) domain-containing protein n=1 Tax=Circinella minor TaxID=1195481 RepID=A0A8H7VEF6_9FUNG|nr:hypothetical protein INT45_001880 [Circinella minor]
MGNSNSTENNSNTETKRENNNTESRHDNSDNNNNNEPAVLSSSSGYQLEKTSPAPPAIVTTEASSSHHRHVPFRLSVTTVPDEDNSAPASATSETAPPLSFQQNDQPSSVITPTTNTPTTTTRTTATPTNMTNTTTPTQAVPLSTGRSGWVSSTGNTSPWYGGSLSSSASSHHRSDSVRGPYYRTRGMSINREQEIEEEQSQSSSQQQSSSQRLNRNRSLVQHSKAGIPTMISWSQGGNNVYVTGTFNGWKHKIKLVKSTQDFATVLELPPGTHRLKFIVDDEWKCSNEMETATDPDGNLVNYLQVIDDENEDAIEELGGGSGIDRVDTRSRSSTPTSEYTSEIPPDLLALAQSLSTEEGQGENNANVEWDQQQQPPSLPPHLEKVLLNSQNLSDEDNSVLPEPNHVTLNHLYASSIKDNVMALSTTTRYRKKYVTTMYYRPVFPKQ